MPARLSRFPISPEIALIALCFTGLLIVHGHRASEMLWTDELISLKVASLEWPRLVEHRYWSGHSPLYFAFVKLWAQANWAFTGVRPSDLSETALRLPSMIAIGVTGGFLAAAAWRTWAPSCGLLFVPLWVTSPIIGRYFVEARPWALLLLALSVGLWSSARLWAAAKSQSEGETSGHKPLWILSVASPVIAAATVPAGIPAVIAAELTMLTLIGRSSNRAFVRHWKRRTAIVLAAAFAVLVSMIPAIRHKSEDYWVDWISPLSLETLGTLADQVVLQRTDWAGFVLVVLIAAGLYLRRNDIAGRAAIGLAIVFPLFMIGMSAVNSLLVTRYFLPAIPGLFLLAAGAGDNRLNLRTLLAAASVLVVSVAFFKAPELPRVAAVQAQQHMRTLKELDIDRINGVATHPHLVTVLEHYIPRRLNIPTTLHFIGHPPKRSALPQDETFWIFDNKGLKPDDPLLKGLTVLCHFKKKRTQIYVVAWRPGPAPFEADACNHN